MEVLVQSWIESEAGWGIRPDGISIHFSKESLKEYVDAYWDRMQKTYGSRTPHEYSRPEGEPVIMTVIHEGADERVLANVLAGKDFRHWENNPKWLKKV